MSLNNPQSFNRYSYTENDPVNFIDPSGLNMAGAGAGCKVRDQYGNEFPGKMGNDGQCHLDSGGGVGGTVTIYSGSPSPSGTYLQYYFESLRFQRATEIFSTWSISIDPAVARGIAERDAARRASEDEVNRKKEENKAKLPAFIECMKREMAPQMRGLLTVMTAGLSATAGVGVKDGVKDGRGGSGRGWRGASGGILVSLIVKIRMYSCKI